MSLVPLVSSSAVIRDSNIFKRQEIFYSNSPRCFSIKDEKFTYFDKGTSSTNLSTHISSDILGSNSELYNFPLKNMVD